MTDGSGRSGFALVVSILAVVLVGALIVATHVAVGLEHTASSAASRRQRAFAASEHALWSTVAEWNAANAALQPGEARTTVVRAAADSATVTTVRLSEQLYWIVAEAAVEDARRRTAVNVRALEDSSGARVEPVRRSWMELH